MHLPAPWLENIEATGPAFSCASVDAGRKECVWQHALHGRRRHDVAALHCKHATWGRRCPAVPGAFFRMVADVYAACISGNHSACAWQHACCFCNRRAVVPPCRCLEMRSMLANCLARLAPFCLPPRPAARLPRAACLRLGNSAETPVARAYCCDLSPLSGIMMVLFCGLCGLYAICSEIRASKLAIIVM